jgi:hypothetical protein
MPASVALRPSTCRPSEENAGRVERFCKEQKNFKLSVMQAVEQVLGKK